jgi:acyl-CoA thioester hydrolase
MHGKTGDGSAGPHAGGSVTYRGVVYPWQCDQMGHMNVMWYVGKFDEATWNFLATLGLTPSFLRARGRGMVAVQQNLTYKQELLSGDLVEVHSRPLEMRERVLRFAHEMRKAETGEVAALCELTAVHLDLATRRSCAFPDEIRRRAEDVLRASAATQS